MADADELERMADELEADASLEQMHFELAMARLRAVVEKSRNLRRA